MKYKAGDTVIVHNPSVIRHDEPAWLNSMDRYDNKTFKISSVSESGKTVHLEGIPWYFSVRWIELLHEEEEEYFDAEDMECLM